MKINLRDLLIVMDCARYTLRIGNQETGWKREDILSAYERIFDETKNVELKITDERPNDEMGER